MYDNSNKVYVQPISFDVMVTVEEGGGVSGKGSLKIVSSIINAEIGGEKNLSNLTANRVQFVIPVLLPVQNSQNPKAQAKSTVTFSE